MPNQEIEQAKKIIEKLWTVRNNFAGWWDIKEVQKQISREVNTSPTILIDSLRLITMTTGHYAKHVESVKDNGELTVSEQGLYEDEENNIKIYWMSNEKETIWAAYPIQLFECSYIKKEI